MHFIEFIYHFSSIQYATAQRFTFVYVFCMKIISHCCLHYTIIRCWVFFFFSYFLSKKFFSSKDTMSEIYFCHFCCFYATSIFMVCSKRCYVCEVSPQIYLYDVLIKVISCVTWKQDWNSFSTRKRSIKSFEKCICCTLMAIVDQLRFREVKKKEFYLI